MTFFIPHDIAVRGHDPERIVWAAYYSHDSREGEHWQMMNRKGEVHDLTVTHTDDRPVARPYRCWPWSHEYVLRHDWADKLNDASTLGAGAFKPYMCRRCGKGKMRWRADIF
jgi:hypothetical protein